MFSRCFNHVDLTFYNTLTHGDDLFQVGDAVELNPSAHRTSLSGDYKVSLHYHNNIIRKVGLLKSKLFGKQKKERNGWNVDGIMELMTWYHHQDHVIVKGIKNEQLLINRELFETDHISNNVVESIVQKVTILSYDDWTQLSLEDQDTTFFCDQFYSYKTTYLRPILGILKG